MKSEINVINEKKAKARGSDLVGEKYTGYESKAKIAPLGLYRFIIPSVICKPVSHLIYSNNVAPSVAYVKPYTTF